MSFIDWSDPDYLEPKYRAGDTVLVRVSKCEERKSKSSGEPFFSLTMEDSDGHLVCFDIIMLGGRGRPMGLAKLRKLGFTEDNKEILAAELIGRRVYVHLFEDTYEGKTRLKVASKFTPEGWAAGYWRESDGDPSLPQRLQEEAPVESEANPYDFTDEDAKEDVPF